MNIIKQETIKKAHKPFDIVTNKNNDVGIIQEVNINDSQSEEKHQLSYAVRWIIGNETKHAWFDHEELTVHANIFVEIAKSATHPFGSSHKWVEKLIINT